MAKEKKDRIKLHGSASSLNANNPVIEITASGRYTYLWVGNNGINDGRCYGYTIGPKTLEKFAVAILKALKSKHLKP